ncbi:alpha/beta fold hydrolase [Paraburkholderia dipogonis]|uniref:Alpha/beta fold hydrolase n=1 Tax=Paraburkholderia dipogonis TaxID=1211383 RepID=A0A4Y8MVZ4_9BURK|nr:alpha/beta fold hydrolase [Paraburkholderia dipogonis]TFE41716.1 alpha/beta fold hydrolase [Paraburkholderia dipogonis]
MNNQPENTDRSEVVLLIHGLGGTQHDLGRLESRIADMGIPTADLMLPGHGSHPDDLRDVSFETWLGAVRRKLAALRERYRTVHLMGMCMGALLALEVAKLEGLGRNGRDRLILLAPPLFLDGWSLPWYRFIRHALYRVPLLARYLKVNERSPYGVKNKRLRTVLARKFSCGHSRHYAWVPLSTIQELDRLRWSAARDLDRVQCSTLIIHAVDDELTSLKSAQYIRDRVNREHDNGKARLAVLGDSYHMICIDNEREDVARQVTAFLAPV